MSTKEKLHREEVELQLAQKAQFLSDKLQNLLTTHFPSWSDIFSIKNYRQFPSIEISNNVSLGTEEAWYAIRHKRDAVGVVWLIDAKTEQEKKTSINQTSSKSVHTQILITTNPVDYDLPFFDQNEDNLEIREAEKLSNGMIVFQECISYQTFKKGKNDSIRVTLQEKSERTQDSDLAVHKIQSFLDTLQRYLRASTACAH